MIANGRSRRLFSRGLPRHGQDRSTASDRETKLPRDAESGIHEVWIVDLQHDEIESHPGPSPFVLVQAE